MLGVLVTTFILFTNYCLSNNINEIEGIWQIPEEIDGQSSIGEVFIKNNKAYAYAFKYVFDDDFSDRDIENEDSSAKHLINTIFLFDLEFNGEKWEHGKIYNPNDGNTYNVSAHLENNGSTLELRVSYDRFGLLGKTLKWHRLEKSMKPKACSRIC